MRKFNSFFLLILLFFLSSAFKIPKPVDYVNDFAGILSEQSKIELTRISKKMKDDGIAEYAVLVIKNIENGDIKGFSQAVFDSWKIGESGKDNGLLLVLSIEDRKIFIQTGYGLEGILTDGEIGNIIDTAILPDLKEKNYDAALIKGSYLLYEKLKAGASPVVKKKKRKNNDFLFFAVFFIIFIVLNIFFRANRRYRGGYIGGGFGGFGGGGFGGFGGGGFGGFGGGSSGGGGAGRSW